MYLCMYIYTYVCVCACIHVSIFTQIDFRMIYMIKGWIVYYRLQSHELLILIIWKCLTRGTNDIATIQNRRPKIFHRNSLFKVKEYDVMRIGRNEFSWEELRMHMHDFSFSSIFGSFWAPDLLNVTTYIKGRSYSACWPTSRLSPQDTSRNMLYQYSLEY